MYVGLMGIGGPSYVAFVKSHLVRRKRGRQFERIREARPKSTVNMTDACAATPQLGVR